MQSHDHDFDPIAACDELVERWTDSPTIELGKTKACYIPSIDTVQMPNPRTFYNDEQYYIVLYLGLTHSVGHEKRLNRHARFPDHRFAGRDYSIEELICEMGAAYLCGICGIENATIDNSAAYIQSWLSKLKNDNKLVVMAASHAQRAVDYILEHQRKPVVSSITNSEKEAISVSFSFESLPAGRQGGVS